MIAKRSEEWLKSCAVALAAAVAACAAQPAVVSQSNADRLTLREAADKGDREAQYRLGNSYCCGAEGSFWDTKEAIKWWCKAAAQGQADATAALARVGGACKPEPSEFPRKL